MRNQVTVDFSRGLPLPWVAYTRWTHVAAAETYAELREKLAAQGVTSYTSTDAAFDEIETICG